MFRNRCSQASFWILVFRELSCLPNLHVYEAGLLWDLFGLGPCQFLEQFRFIMPTKLSLSILVQWSVGCDWFAMDATIGTRTSKRMNVSNTIKVAVALLLVATVVVTRLNTFSNNVSDEPNPLDSFFCALWIRLAEYPGPFNCRRIFWSWSMLIVYEWIRYTFME
jgi:hypothetical protein